jgi:hypothetical protein
MCSVNLIDSSETEFLWMLLVFGIAILVLMILADFYVDRNNIGFKCIQQDSSEENSTNEGNQEEDEEDEEIDEEN